MKTKIFLFGFFCFISSCHHHHHDNLCENALSTALVGEWVADHPEDGTWEAMYFSPYGRLSWSQNPDQWSNERNKIGGAFFVNGMDVSGTSAPVNNSNVHYLDMTIQKINGYEFTTRFNDTSYDVVFNKVLRSKHLEKGEVIAPDYRQFVSDEIIAFKSHDEAIAMVDPVTGTITAVAENGRTYVDIVTKEGTGVYKVMIGNIDDGDENSQDEVISSIDNPTSRKLSEAIIGQWICDLPKEGLYDNLTFLKTGVIYVVYKSELWLVEADEAGTYEVNGNDVTVNYVHNGIMNNVVFTVVSIGDFQFNAFFHTTGITYPYSRLLGKVDARSYDTVNPDYADMVKEATISEFKSHNEEVFEVNTKTGEIIAKKGGVSYLDVITNKGVANVEITVKNPILDIHLDGFVWNDKKRVVETFGSDQVNDDGNGKIIYEPQGGEFESFSFDYDAGNVVTRVIATPRYNAYFTYQEMMEYLKSNYTPYDKSSTNKVKAFINADNYNDATVLIGYYPNNPKRLICQQIIH